MGVYCFRHSLPAPEYNWEWLMTSDAISSAWSSKLMQGKLEIGVGPRNGPWDIRQYLRMPYSGSSEDGVQLNLDMKHQSPKYTFLMFSLVFLITQKYSCVNNKTFIWRCSFPDKSNVSSFTHGRFPVFLTFQGSCSQLAHISKHHP